MNVHVLCEHPRGRSAATRLKRRASAFLASLGHDGAELSILLVGDRGMRRLNRAWRGHDVSTDVLSFPAAESKAALLGDVVISLDTATRVARAEQRSVVDELDRYLLHGILHLLGFDHETEGEARAMAAREDEVLGAHGMVSAVRREVPKPAAKPRSSSRSGARSSSRSGAGPRSKSASKSRSTR